MHNYGYKKEDLTKKIFCSIYYLFPLSVLITLFELFRKVKAFVCVIRFEKKNIAEEHIQYLRIY
jgi:hypothetical protein